MGTAKRERQKINRQERLQQIEKQQARRQTKRRGFVIGGFIAAFVAAAAIIAITTGGDDGDESTTGTTVPAVTTTALGATTTAAASATTQGTSVPTVPGATTVPGAELLSETPCPASDGSSARTITFALPPPTCIDPAKTYTAAVETNKGALTIALDPAAAPIAVNNFVVLARYHYYDGTPCHRIMADFVVQCGDPAGNGGPTYPGYNIAEEPPADASAYKRGVVAMAKGQGPNATGGQFFIVLSDTPGLTAEYSIIGTVTDGLDTTVPALAAAANPAGNNGVPPLEPIDLSRITITEA